MAFLEGLINGYEMASGKAESSDPYGITAPFETMFSQRPSSFQDKSPIAQFGDMATEAFNPGYISGNERNAANPSDNGITWDAPSDNPATSYQIPQMPIHNENGYYAANSPITNYAQQQDTPFRDSTFGTVLGGMMPNTVGRVFDMQRGNAIRDFASSQAAENPTLAPIAAMIAHDDPRNAASYLPAIIQAQQALPELQHRQKIAQYLQSLEGNGGNSQSPTVGAPPQIPAAGAPPMSGSPPVGVRDNNFTNIKDSPQNNWQGQVGVDNGFAKFDTPEAGFRAAAKTLDTYSSRGIDNIDDLVKSWAPASDNNNPDDYAAFVSKETGIDRNQKINLSDPDTQAKIINAMQKVEVGKDKAASPDIVQRGVDMAHGGAMAPMAGFKDQAQQTAPQQAAPVSALQQLHQSMTPEESMAVHIASIDPTPQNIQMAVAAFGKKGQLTPHTPAAQAQADLSNGLITQAQYDQMEKSGFKEANAGNVPSSIQEANAYEEAKGLHTKEGDQRAADIAMFAKTSGLSGMAANIDPSVKGDDFINAMTTNGQGALAGIVKSIGDNDSNAASILSRGSLADKAALISAVKQYKPGWNQRQYEAIADFNTGTHGDQVKFTSNVTEHLEMAREIFKALDNGDVPLFNKLSQAWAEQTGNEAPTDFDSAINIIGQETVKSIVPSGGGVSDREEAQKAFDRAKSNHQGNGAINTVEKMLKTQIRGNERQFVNSTGGNRKDFLRLISPSSAAILYPEESAASDKGSAAPDMSALQAAATAELNRRGH